MGTLGEALRTARQARGLSLSDFEAATKIRRKYVAALEDDNYAELPPPVYVRGYVRTYARYVGLDPAAMVALYDQASPQAEIIGVQREVRPLRTPGGITGGTLAALLLIVVLATSSFYLYQQYTLFVTSSSPSAVASPTPGPRSVTSAPARIVPPVEALPTPSPIPTAPPVATPTPIQGVHLEIKVKERSWLRVLVDDQPMYEGIPQLGSSLRWDGRDKIFMRTGNANGIEAVFNGKSEGALGAPGEVKDIQWTAAR